MSTGLFVYGTLAFPELMQALIGSVPPSAGATLKGYRRGLMAGRRYPGIVASAGDRVHGTVYFDLDQPALDRIDVFEADEYERREVTVEQADGSSQAVFAYVVVAECAEIVTATAWDADAFRRRHLADYLAALEHA